MRGRVVLVIGVVGAIGAFSASCTSTSPNAESSRGSVRAAFYYPWYPETWAQGTHYHPDAGHYDSGSLPIVRRHITEMQASAIQAGVASWWGPGSRTDQRFPILLRAAGNTTFRWTAYYEPEGYANPSSTQIGADLAYLARYASRRSWLRRNGKPVLFVYAGADDDCGMADRWAHAPGRASWYLVLKAVPDYRACANQPDDWHQYAPAGREARAGRSITISPGFYESSETRPRLARDLIAWRHAVAHMRSAHVRWQLITSFNEWGEGTAIEAAREWNTTYLDSLR